MSSGLILTHPLQVQCTSETMLNFPFIITLNIELNHYVQNGCYKGTKIWEILNQFYTIRLSLTTGLRRHKHLS